MKVLLTLLFVSLLVACQSIPKVVVQDLNEYEQKQVCYWFADKLLERYTGMGKSTRSITKYMNDLEVEPPSFMLMSSVKVVQSDIRSCLQDIVW